MIEYRDSVQPNSFEAKDILQPGEPHGSQNFCVQNERDGTD
jgi:hypothetical protein